ncbi:hypothetical protein ACTI_60830 [Actinoplanes sp. OR16]|uniref:hypothetical protein n=1 Tax=Actinoplanes sp. OR16 TaxID=946334 RepID=UPI000F70C94E|nr:hypothetical protein [Actinoplanes sp. OR16]BBH69398.1 hypothetical protein ACTI_60830 [Actinoplanes sp. OR16]
MEQFQHLAAFVAALLLGGASVLQARHALAKAEHERRRIPGAAHHVLPSSWHKPIPGETTFDVQHFRRVAALWWVIVAGSVLGALAEAADWAA